MTAAASTVDDLAGLCVALARDEVGQILAGKDRITLSALTACELIALLAVVRPAWERERLAQGQLAPVLALVPRQDGGA